LSPKWWATIPFIASRLSLRFRSAVLFTAITAAFAGKMLVVLLAKMLVRLISGR
jgi:hypothetical protein